MYFNKIVLRDAVSLQVFETTPVPVKRCVFSINVSYLVDDLNSQPEITAAPNQRPFRCRVQCAVVLFCLCLISNLFPQERLDKYASTLETEPDYLDFVEKSQKPVDVSALGQRQCTFDPLQQKRPSAELQYDTKAELGTSAAAAATALQIKNNPLLKFLREKGERKMQERRAARDKAKGLVSSALGGKSVQVTGLLVKNGKTVKIKVPSAFYAFSSSLCRSEILQCRCKGCGSERRGWRARQ